MSGTDFWGKPGGRSVLPAIFAAGTAAAVLVVAGFAGLLSSRYPAQQMLLVLGVVVIAAFVYFAMRRYLDREFAAVQIYGADAPVIDDVRGLLLLEIGPNAPAASEIYVRALDDASERVAAPSAFAHTVKERASAEIRGVVRAAMMESHPRFVAAALLLAAYDMQRTSSVGDELQFREIIARRLGG